jgi:hypothetical protein
MQLSQYMSLPPAASQLAFLAGDKLLPNLPAHRGCSHCAAILPSALSAPSSLDAQLGEDVPQATLLGGHGACRGSKACTL